MSILKAIRYRNLEEARRALSTVAPKDVVDQALEDGSSEPHGLLAIVAEDRLPEEFFYRLFGAKVGVLVEVERVDYSGYGPPAEEDDYIGFASQSTAYVMKGCRIPIEIPNCPDGARDLHHLESLVLEKRHALNREDLAERLGLDVEWEFEDLFDLVASGQTTGEEIDRLVHQGIQ